MRKIYIVTDLGPGDGGKGGVVHKISHLRRAHTILKVGGAQGSHGVHTSGGDKFAFSQFGCGTFEGVHTHLTERFVVSPEGILNEADALRYRHGIHSIFDLLTVDEDVVCTTHFHGISSRLKELVRRENLRGTVGTGVGEAYRYNQYHPELTIRARDLLRPDLRDRIVAVRERLCADLEPLIKGDFLSQDRELAAQEIERLNDPNFLDYVVSRFKDAGRHIRIVGSEYFHNLIARDGVMVVESSHGVLTDRFQGFHPHTSAIRTLPRFTRAMLEDAQYDGEVVSIGVTRAYQIRHGAGPMPTADRAMEEGLFPGSSKEENRYQGKVRVGPLDLVLLRYAIASCGGPNAFDGLAITWFDQIQRNGVWSLCDSYRYVGDRTFVSSSDELKVRFGEDEAQLAYQEELGEFLKRCDPNLTEFDVNPDSGRDDVYSLCAEVLRAKLGVDVRMVSFGATERDKLCR